MWERLPWEGPRWPSGGGAVSGGGGLPAVPRRCHAGQLPRLSIPGFSIVVNYALFICSEVFEIDLCAEEYLGQCLRQKVWPAGNQETCASLGSLLEETPGARPALLANHVFCHLKENDSFLLFTSWDELMLSNRPRRRDPSARTLRTPTRLGPAAGRAECRGDPWGLACPSSVT